MTQLIVLAVSVVLNIGGDLLLIVVLHMGVLGAAVATVLSQLIAVVVCAIYLWKKYVILRIRVNDLKLQDAGMLRNMLSSGPVSYTHLYKGLGWPECRVHTVFR